jgi:hypothetical protein
MGLISDSPTNVDLPFNLPGSKSEEQPREAKKNNLAASGMWMRACALRNRNAIPCVVADLRTCRFSCFFILRQHSSSAAPALCGIESPGNHVKKIRVSNVYFCALEHCCF